MSDKKKKDPDNPFAKLDVKQFPTEQPKSAPAQRSKSAAAKKSAPLPEGDPDAELFMLAMGSVSALPAKDDARPGKLKEPAIQEPDPDQALWMAMQESGLAKKSKTKIKPGVSASSDRHGHSPVDASPMATPAIDSALLQEAVGLADGNAESQEFYKAVAGAAPLLGKGREIAPEPEPQTPPALEPFNPLQDIVDGKLEFALSSSDEFLEGHVVGLDLLTIGKLQTRQYSPEAHIDLHGLNSEQAYQNLVAFFRGAYHKGVRTALIITGRGLNSPNGVPVLRLKVQDWLTHEPFRRVVLAFCTAKREDGGPGALYVLLRKYRKNSGKVRWDALPSDPDLFF